MNVSDRNSAITILGRVMSSVNSNIFQPPENAESIQPMRVLLAGVAKVRAVNFFVTLPPSQTPTRDIDRDTAGFWSS